jgi:hypothetical protein
MSRKICWLALVFLCLSALSGAATNEPAKSSTILPSQAQAAPAAEPPAPAPAWLQPPPSQSIAGAGGKAQGAVFLNACSIACEATYQTCDSGCHGNQRCILLCNNDYHCCIQTCIPNSPQCP